MCYRFSHTSALISIKLAMQPDTSQHCDATDMFMVETSSCSGSLNWNGLTENHSDYKIVPLNGELKT